MANRWRDVAISALAAVGLGASALGELAPGASATTPVARTVHRSLHGLSAAPRFTVNGYLDKGKDREGVLVRSSDHRAEAEGRLTVGPAKGRPTELARFVQIGPNLYVHGNERFWVAAAGGHLSSAVREAASGRWVKLTGAGAKAAARILRPLLDPGRVVRELVGTTPSPTDDVRTVRGRHARAVLFPAHHAALYVSTATGRPVEIQRRKGDARGDLLFSYPRSFDITAPHGARSLRWIEHHASTKAPARPLPGSRQRPPPARSVSRIAAALRTPPATSSGEKVGSSARARSVAAWRPAPGRVANWPAAEAM